MATKLLDGPISPAYSSTLLLTRLFLLILHIGMIFPASELLHVPRAPLDCPSHMGLPPTMLTNNANLTSWVPYPGARKHCSGQCKHPLHLAVVFIMIQKDKVLWFIRARALQSTPQCHSALQIFN